MKLTEQQLAEIYKLNNQKQSSAEFSAGDCLSAAPASSDRLARAEEILNEQTSAQAIRAAMATRKWSHAVAESIELKQQSWLTNLFRGTALRWAAAGATFAFVFMLASPGLRDHEPVIDPVVPVINQNAVNDVINKAYFEERMSDNDRLNKAGFDKPNIHQTDVLSSRSFG